MASGLIRGEARHSRLSDLIDTLASPDRELVKEPHPGLTLWQTVRMYLLQLRWFDVSTSYKAFFDVAGDTTPGYGNDSVNFRHKPCSGKFRALSAIKTGSTPDSAVRIPLGSAFDRTSILLY